MSHMPLARFAVSLTPLPTAARVAGRRRALWWRVGSSIISGAILAVLIFVVYPEWDGLFRTIAIVVWVVTSLLWLIGSIVSLQRAKADLAAIGPGQALFIDQQGLEFVYPEHRWLTWQQLSALKLSGPNLGAGPRLVALANGQPVAKIPMSFLDAPAETIDSVVRAQSRGTARLDVSDLDRLF